MTIARDYFGSAPVSGKYVSVGCRALAVSSTLLIILFLGSANVQPQTSTPDAGKKRTPELVERYGRFITEETSLLVDLLRKKVHDAGDAKGYIVVYCGKVCRQGEIEAHLTGIVLALQLKKEPNENFRVLFGGFRNDTETEFWFVPKGSQPPEFASSVPIGNVKFKGKFDRDLVPYYCCS